jgi:hypothetical protein
MRKYLLILIVPLAFSCNTPPTNPAAVADSIKAILYADKATRALQKRPGLDSITTIQFPDLTCKVEGYVPDPPNLWFASGNDTIGVTTSELGYLPLGNFVTVQSDQLTDIKMDFRFTTVSCLHGGKRLLCLHNFQPFVSNWEALPASNDSFYVRSLSESEVQQFNAVNLDEWKKNIRMQLSQTYYESAKSLQSVNEFPALVALDQLQFRVTGKRKSDGAPVSRVIILKVPLG